MEGTAERREREREREKERERPCGAEGDSTMERHLAYGACRD